MQLMWKYKGQHITYKQQKYIYEAIDFKLVFNIYKLMMSYL